MASSSRGDVLPAVKGMDCLRTVQAALEADEARQEAKYPDYDGLDPMYLSARYHKELPREPQHLKYQWPFVPYKRMPSPPNPADSPSRRHPYSSSDSTFEVCGEEGDGTEEEKVKGVPVDGFQLDIRSLDRLFKVVDVEGSGYISQKQLKAALRQHEKLFQLLCRVHGLYLDDSLDKRGREAIVAKRETMRRLAELMALVDTDFNGFIEWDEFVTLFRKAGLLLEYESRADLNRTAMCQEMEARRRKEEHMCKKSGRKTDATVLDELPTLLLKCDGGRDKPLRGLLAR